MIIYGRNPVREALRGSRRVQRIYATKNAAREPWLSDASERTERRPSEDIERLCGSTSHQGMCAEVEPFPYQSADSLLAAETPLIVALDQVQDPQNVGSICRSAECAGASGVVLLERRSALVTPAVCKASAGAVEHLPIARVRNLFDFLGEAKQAGLWCYGADAGASASYDSVDYSGGMVLVLGSEGRGLRPRVAAACDMLVSVPVRGRIDSLSVAAAAALMLYAASPAQ